MTGKFEVVYWAENEAEAVVILSMFEQYGIPAKKLRESYGAMNNLSFGIFGQIAIAVEHEHVHEAEALILSMEDEISQRESEEGFSEDKAESPAGNSEVDADEPSRN